METRCEVDGCFNARSGYRRMCSAHAHRLRRYGDPLVGRPMRATRLIPIEYEIALRTWYAGPKDCWRWMGPVSSSGYPQILCRYAHRVIFEIANGRAPDGFEVDHQCRNKLCVNPAHLRIATSNQNKCNQAANRRSKSGIRGVWKIPSGRWTSQIHFRGVCHNVGTFNSAEEAARARDEKARELHGDFAFTHGEVA